MRRTAFIIGVLAITTMAFSQDLTYRQRLFYSCKVWGLIKYYHSRVSVCQVNWDSVLLRTLPAIKTAMDRESFNDVLDSMLVAAGPILTPTTPPPATLPPELRRNLEFSWIEDPVFRQSVKSFLDSVTRNFRPHDICWVGMGFGQSFLVFPYDDPMISKNTYLDYPDEPARLLMLFKYWNIMRYFNPNNYIEDHDWDSTLLWNVLNFAEADNYSSLFRATKQLTSACDDAHTEAFTKSTATSLFNDYLPRVLLKYSRGKYVVVKSLISGISKGDVIDSVEGKTPEQWEDSLRPYISAGNPSVFRRMMCMYMLTGPYSSQVRIVSIDSAGIRHGKTYSRMSPFDSWFAYYSACDSLATVKFRRWSCNTGYVNMGKLIGTDVSLMYESLKSTSAIIFDIRNYPNGTAWQIASLMYPFSTTFAKFTVPDTNYPGTFSWVYNSLGYTNPDSYKGKVILLCNQETQSQAEFTCMMFKAMQGSVVIGSQTAGADGNVVYLKLSKDISSAYSGMGVFYPNGDSTQRIGIVPDSLVYITAEGTRQGRDELLEKALQVAGCLEPMLSVSPLQLDVQPEAGEAAFTITCNTNWSAQSDAAWCRVTASGSGNSCLIVEYEENSQHQPRTASILVTVPSLPGRTVKLIQSRSSIGLREACPDEFVVSPNPGSGEFRVSGLRSGTEGNFTVVNVYGKALLNGNFKTSERFRFDLSSFPCGIYYLLIEAEGKTTVRKLSLVR
ncbi:MAG: S41 family peptidase [Bacteroidota bacterium]